MEEEKPISMRDKLIFYKNSVLPSFTPSRLEYNRAQVERLRQLPQPEQRSKEWYDMRHSMLSASDWGSILGMSKYGGGKNQVLIKKCSDDVPFFTNDAMQWGIKYESVAIQIYEHRNQTKVIEFGCIRHPTIHHLGASPDGITSDGVMVEIKCPSSREIDGIIPEGYYAQVQGQLEVCELDRCDFLECKLYEYDNESDYENDHNKENNYFYNHYGGEKGVVANFYNTQSEKLCYEYSELGIRGEELMRWKNDILEKYKNMPQYQFRDFSYWFLERVSCIPIYRNQEWFYKASKELEAFWNQVCHYRRVGVEQLKNDIQKEKDDKKAEKDALKTAILPVKKSYTPRNSTSKNKKITDFMNMGIEEVNSDEEFHKNSGNMNIMSIFSDETTNNQTFQPAPVIKKNDVKIAPAKKSTSTMKKGEKPSYNILNIFTDDELKEIRK